MYFVFCRKPLPNPKAKGEYSLCTRTIFCDSDVDAYIKGIPSELEPIKIPSDEIFRATLPMGDKK